MLEQLPKRTLEMYNARGRSLEADAVYARWVRHFFGEPGLEFAEALRQGKLRSHQVEDFRDRIDTHYFNAFTNTYSVDGSITPKSAYLNAQEVALGVVRDCILKAFPRYEDDLLRNEVALRSPSPTDLYYYMVLPDQGELGAYEVRRHFLLLNDSAAVDARSGNGNLAIPLSDINRLLDEELFERGSGQPTTICADHDSQTNTVSRVSYVESEKPLPNAIFRKHTLTAREIEGIGLVQTRVRQKDLVSAVEKMLSKAATNGGVLDPGSVNDLMGFTLIALGGTDSISSQDQLDLLEDKTVDVLNSHRYVTEFKPDNEADRDRGQAEVRFRRLLVFLSDQPIPLEIIFYDALEYLNSISEVGVEDPKTGFYNGRDHDLYVLRRMYPIMPYVYPKEVYQRDAQAALVYRSHDLADQKRRIGGSQRYLFPNGVHS